MLVDKTSPSEIFWLEIFDCVECLTPARKLQTLHIAAFGATQSKDALLGKEIKRRWVDALQTATSSTSVCSVILTFWLMITKPGVLPSFSMHT